MAVQPQYLAYVLEQLATMPALRSNRMFGGVGLYSDGIFFGLIDDDTLYFKTGENNIADYLARNMPKFMPFPDKTRQVLGYHQVPADVIEDSEVLVVWARKSKDAALAKKASKVRAVPRKASKVRKPPKAPTPSKAKKASAPRKKAARKK
jgi:DNA transformation protein and related proteins